MKIYLSLILTIFFISCKKESSLRLPIIIEPSPYYPAYPGSYWLYYSNYSNDTVIVQIEPNYKLHSYKSHYNNNMPTDSVLVPFINSTPIYGYSIPEQPYNYNSASLYSGYILKPFLDTVLGVFYRETTHYHGANNVKEVTQILDTMTVRGNIYQNVIEVTTSSYDNNQALLYRTKTYYVKNIGRIKSIITNTVYNPIYLNTGVELISYNINH